MPTFADLLRQAFNAEHGVKPPGIAPAQASSSPETVVPTTGPATTNVPSTESGVADILKDMPDFTKKIQEQIPSYYEAAKKILGPFDEKPPKREDYPAPQEMPWQTALGMTIGAGLSGNLPYLGEEMRGYQESEARKFAGQEAARKDYQQAERDYLTAKHQYNQSVGQLAGQQMSDVRALYNDIYRFTLTQRAQDLSQIQKMIQRNMTYASQEAKLAYQKALLAFQNKKLDEYSLYMAQATKLEQARIQKLAADTANAAQRLEVQGPAAISTALDKITTSINNLQVEGMALDSNDPAREVKLAAIQQATQQLEDTRMRLAAKLTQMVPGLPPGAKQIGTVKGQPVYQTPDGKYWNAQGQELDPKTGQPLR